MEQLVTVHGLERELGGTTAVSIPTLTEYTTTVLRVIWHHWKNPNASLKKTEMKIQLKQ